MLNGLIATIDRIEDVMVVIKTDDGQELIVAKDFLPPSIKEGDRININFDINKADTTLQLDTARKLLKNILNNSHDDRKD